MSVIDAVRASDSTRAEGCFQALFDGHPLPMLVYDAETLAFLEVNRAAVEFYGWSRAQFLTLTITDIRPVDDRAHFMAWLAAARRSLADVTPSAWRHCRSSGEVLHVEVAASAIAFRGRPAILAVVRDLGEGAQAAMLERTARVADDRIRLLRRALQSTSDLVCVTDLDGVVQYANRAFVETFGCSEAALFGRPIDAVDHQLPIAEIRRATLDGGWTGEVTTRRHDGAEITIALNTSIVRDEHGAPMALLASGRDITAHRAAERAAHVMEQQLRQAQKMEAIGQLAGGVAHDFNNLLTAILGYTALLSDSLAAGDARRQDLSEIEKAAERAAGLTRQLLAFSRKQMLTPRVLNLGDVVEGLAPMLRRLLGETVDLRTEIANAGHVLADPGQIEQVLINLAVNARDAMAGGGKLTLLTADVTLDAEFVRTHAGAKPGPHVLVAVSDTGCGMDAATLEHIFEPFFTTKPKGKGTGLGLATVYGIVKQSGGGIWVTSRPGEGTTFSVYLPAVNRPVQVEVTDRFEGPRGSETVLLVEDEPLVRDLVQRLLVRHGYTVHVMATSPAAVEFVAAFEGAIHMVLTDVVMPELGGRAVVEAVHSRHPEARALYMSGYTNDEIAHSGIVDDPGRFVQKPFAASQLLRKIRDVLDARV